MAKPMIVLLHGVGLDRRMWRPVRALLQDEFEILALDLLGHGGNKPARPGTTLRDMADAAAASLPAAAHLVGFSLGALVAQHLARYRPELVASLISVSSVCRRTEAERAAVLERLAAAEADFPASVETSLQRWYAGTATDAALVGQTRATLLANDLPSYLNCYRVFATADAEISPELPRIAVASLAVTGELDPGSTPEMTRRLAGAIPGCRAVVVPDARHMLPVERPRELVMSLRTFIRERGNVRSATV